MKLRIVRDKFSGYEVQRKVWWFPFWVQCNFVNTHSSIEDAEEWASLYVKGFVVKELDI